MRRPGQRRILALAAVMLAAAVLAWLLERPLARHGDAVAARDTGSAPASMQSLFSTAVLALQEGYYRRAERLLRHLLQLAPALPEAHVNHGYALLHLGRHDEARAAFLHALTLRSTQANAYYGLGVAQDALGHRAEALGAMRSYIHLAPPAEPHVRKARAAIWEWQSTSRQRPMDDSPGDEPK